jgi:hypothetical protein
MNHKRTLMRIAMGVTVLISDIARAAVFFAIRDVLPAFIREYTYTEGSILSGSVKLHELIQTEISSTITATVSF